jgi:hypothetical protein
MVLRHLFYVASSLLSGSAVAALFITLVLHFFPDPTDHQKPPVMELAAHRDARSPEPTGSVTRPVTQGGLERVAADISPVSRQTQAALEAVPDPVTIVRSNREPSSQQRHPEPTVLTQEAAIDMPAESVQEPTPSTAAPDPATQQDIPLVAQVSAREREPEPISQQNSQAGTSIIATSLAVGDVHARSAAGGRATHTRAGAVTRGPHAGHARRGQIGHPGDHRQNPVRHISLGQ